MKGDNLVTCNKFNLLATNKFLVNGIQPIFQRVFHSKHFSSFEESVLILYQPRGSCCSLLLRTSRRSYFPTASRGRSGRLGYVATVDCY